MSKIRVYELARELNMESKALVNRLKEMGIVVSSHQSTISNDQITKVKAVIGGGAKPAEAPRSSPKVIRRRRRAVAPEPESLASPAPAAAGTEGEGSPAEDAGAGATAAAGAPAAEADQAGEPAATSAAPTPAREDTPEPSPAEAEVAQAAPAQAGTEELKPAAAESDTGDAAATPTGEQAPVAAAASEAEETPSAAASADSAPAEPASESASATPRPSPPKEGGARIIRKATPEEVASRRAAAAPQERKPRRPPGPGERPAPASGRPGGPGSRPGGGRPDRPQGAPAAAMPAGDMEDPKARLWRSGERRGGNWKKPKEEESAAAKRTARSRRDVVSTRQLLERAETRDEDVPAPSKKRTVVYTPTASNRKRDLKRRKDLKKTQITTPRAAYRVVNMGEQITVADLARQMSVKAADIIKKLMSQGVMVSINQSIDFDTASLIATEYKFEVKSNVVTEDDILKKSQTDIDVADIVERPPIVTIMGHVDHGKTSILDAIRQSSVAEGESGGITQHIGAYTVERNGKTICFLDTPGHEAFSAMRSRGAGVTDIVILVVAADDGVMPQTQEAISHAKDAGVPLIVAINKIDKPNVNLDRINTELMEQGIQSEEWGGETQFVKVSALERIGLDDLIEAVLLQAEILELKAVALGPASGVVVEAHLDKGRGPVATVIVQDGTLRVGDCLVAGQAVGRVRGMCDHNRKNVEEAWPSTPVEVIGLADVPMAGDRVNVLPDEKTAKEVADWRRRKALEGSVGRSSAATLEELLGKVSSGETPEVPVIVKADTQGSVEAIIESIQKLNSEKVRNKIVHKAVGGITESDIALGEASGAIVIGFNVRAGRGLDDIAEKSGVPVNYFSVIYDIVDAVKALMAGRLPPIQTEVIQGHAEVRKTIKVPKIGVVAGTAVTDGKITRNSMLRLIRDDVVIYAGKVGSLRRFKDDVREVMSGYECGIGIEGHNDIREGDVIESFVIEEEAATL